MTGDVADCVVVPGATLISVAEDVDDGEIVPGATLVSAAGDVADSDVVPGAAVVWETGDVALVVVAVVVANSTHAMMPTVI